MKKSLLILLLSSLTLTGCGNKGTQGNKGDNESGEHKEATLLSIYIKKSPAKTTYIVGQSFSPIGMVVKGKYSDETEKTIENYTYSTEKFTTVGTVDFEISFEGKKTSVELTIKASKDDIEEQEYTETIMSSGVTFVASFKDGYHFDTEQHKQDLAQYFYDQVEYENLITNVETDNLHARKFNSITYLQFGSGSNAIGSFKWTSKEKIYKVEFKVCCYAKEDDYDRVVNIDNWSHIAIDSTDYDLTYDGKTLPEMKTFSKEYPEGVTSFTLSSSMGRVLMESMTITWRG